MEEPAEPFSLSGGSPQKLHADLLVSNRAHHGIVYHDGMWLGGQPELDAPLGMFPKRTGGHQKSATSNGQVGGLSMEFSVLVE
ncbi:MAG TPA: hypothetical protein VGA17_07170 [Nitrospiraceae bacterium]